MGPYVRSSIYTMSIDGEKGMVISPLCDIWLFPGWNSETKLTDECYHIKWHTRDYFPPILFSSPEQNAHG